MITLLQDISFKIQNQYGAPLLLSPPCNIPLFSVIICFLFPYPDRTFPYPLWETFLCLLSEYDKHFGSLKLFLPFTYALLSHFLNLPVLSFKFLSMSSVHRYNFTFSFQIWISFIYFSCLIALKSFLYELCVCRGGGMEGRKGGVGDSTPGKPQSVWKTHKYPGIMELTCDHSITECCLYVAEAV